MSEIDWTAPLEAYHPDGMVRAVTAVQMHGANRINRHDCGGPYFYPDGTDGGYSQWRIRNRKKPEAPAPPVTVELMAEIERVITNGANGKDVWPDECRAILAALNPPEVDPLLVEAREICIAASLGHSPRWADDVRAGIHDDYAEIRAALAALRRGMELADAKHPLTITEARHVGD